MRDITFKSLAFGAVLGGTLMLSLPMEATIVNDHKDARRIVLSEQGEKLPITLAISPVSNGGSLYNYSGTDENGDTFLFQVNTPFTSQEEILDEDGNPTGETKTVVDNSKITLRGITTTAQYVTTPDEIVISDGAEDYKVPVVNVYFSDGEYVRYENDYSYWVNDGYSFENAPSLGRIFLSENVKNIKWGGNFNVKESNTAPRDYHFISESVPVISEIGSQLRIYVPNSLRETYVEGLKNQVTTSIWSEEYAPVTVNVASPGTLASSISDYVDNLETVNWLIVTGTPNSDDCRLFRRMPYLEELDLSAVTGLEEMAGCNNLQYLRKVTLPEGLKTIGEAAFEKCTALEEINLPDGITEIKKNAFYNTISLKSIDFPESLVSLGSYSFYGSPLINLDLKNVEVLSERCFEDSKLEEVDFGKNLKYIGWCAFSGNRKLKKAILPEGLLSIDGFSFSGCSALKEISVPSTVISFSSYYCLAGTNSLESLIVKMLFPCNGDEPFKEFNENCVLYVPALTINEYMYSDVFRNFKFVEPIEEDLTELTIRDREYHLVSNEGLAEKADLTVKDSGHLTIARKETLSVGNYSQSGTYPTLIVESEVTADAVELSKSLQTNRWHFLSFPFDINVKDIVVDEDALWVVRKYNGENRAAMDDSKATWENMADNDVLKAGEGYIFHCAKENGSSVNFTFRPAENGNAYFAKDDVVKELAEYPSEFPHNASWNLVGNTFPAYLNLKAIDFDGPVTVYTNQDYYGNGNYEAFSPLDDDFVFSPFQAFFVQKQEVETGDKLTLKPEGRAHSEAACRELYVENEEQPLTRAASERALFNIHLKGDKGSDRARLVINEEASTAYEANRDASKFMAMDADAPQIYLLNNGVAMAIDEQPLGVGNFEVGTRMPKGTYTISLSTKRADNYQLFLLDKKTGKETNISEGDYLFDTDGNDSNRFIVSVRPFLIQSGVEEVRAAETTISAVGNNLVVKCPVATEINVYAADGRTVVSTVSANLSQELPAGVYVVKAGEKVAKVALGN